MEYFKAIQLMNNFYKDAKDDNFVTYSFQYYFIVFVYGLFLVSCHYKNPFLVIWFLYGILPILDHFIKIEARNPTREEQKKISRDLRFKIPVYLSVLFDWVFLIWGLREIFTNTNGYFYSLGVFLLIGTLQASSINLSHEINHKTKKWERVIGTLNLSKNLYMHFLIEHNEGHHKKVSTPEDPASSRFNESLYKFLPRSIIGGFFSAWNIENKRCLEMYKNAFTIYNRMIYFSASYVLIPLLVFYIFGWKVMVVFLLKAFMSFAYLEVINYLEHYGLQRKKLENGQYENVNITHSWNSPHRFSNYILFKLQRHSDHHENSLKPYQSLCSYDDSPTLPNGYPICLLLATFPNLWFSIMNPMVISYNKGEKLCEIKKKEIQDSLMRFIYYVNLVLMVMVSIQFYFIR